VEQLTTGFPEKSFGEFFRNTELIAVCYGLWSHCTHAQKFLFRQQN